MHVCVVQVWSSRRRVHHLCRRLPCRYRCLLLLLRRRRRRVALLDRFLILLRVLLFLTLARVAVSAVLVPLCAMLQ